jgi:transposase
MPPKFEDLPKDDLVGKALDLWYENQKLKQLLFGTKSERFISETPHPEQLSIFGEDPAAVVPEPEKETITYERDKPKPVKTTHGRGFIPAHLERVVTVLEPLWDTTGMIRIGEEVTEVLEYRPGKLYVRQIIRPKYARPDGEGIVVAPAPERPIDKIMAGTSLAAQLIVSKYVDHLPFHRQIAMFARQGVKFPASTVGEWMVAYADLLIPLYKKAKETILITKYLQADETTIRVLDEGKKGECHKGYFWACHAVEERIVLFHYDKGRSKKAALETLGDLKNTHLQTDYYIAYEQFAHKEGVVMHACMAHVRRKFFEALNNDRKAAETMLGAFRWLYAVEDLAREWKGKEEYHVRRRELRQEFSKPMMEIMKEWLDNKYPFTTPKSPIGEAVAYALKVWPRLTAYLEYGYIEIDNNFVENKMRPVALGRKNYLFAGSHEAAQRAAMVYSFMATCSLNEVNPMEWLEDVFNRIQTHPINRIEELFPAQWKEAKMAEGKEEIGG